MTPKNLVALVSTLTALATMGCAAEAEEVDSTSDAVQSSQFDTIHAFGCKVTAVPPKASGGLFIAVSATTTYTCDKNDPAFRATNANPTEVHLRVQIEKRQHGTWKVATFAANGRPGASLTSRQLGGFFVQPDSYVGTLEAVTTDLFCSPAGENVAFRTHTFISRDVIGAYGTKTVTDEVHSDELRLPVCPKK